MRVLELTGVVSETELQWDEHWLENTEGPKIGDRYVIAALHEAFPETHISMTERRPLTVLLAHGGDETLYRGTAWAVEGDRGYSSMTPGTGPDIWVGGEADYPHQHQDLFEKLCDLEGQTVHLRVDDAA